MPTDRSRSNVCLAIMRATKSGMMSTTTILVAEDDENDRFLIQRAFTKTPLDITIAFACDGQETIEYLEQLDCRSQTPVPKPSLFLLLDLKMPRIDGFQVLEWLLENPDHRPSQVVVFSSSSDPRDIERAKALGADSYTIKPHDIAEYVRIAQDLKSQIPSPTNLPRAFTSEPDLSHSMPSLAPR